MAKQPKQKTDLIEDGMRRINRKTMAAGFGPLSIKDIEGILTKLQPPRAIRKPVKASSMPAMSAPSGVQGMGYGR